ncbi:MAG: cysteine--tRNA ligase, partial [Frondihabitans sp.]|nr:cysteine--tRNA ligase [Frondihabitans sp.]
MTIRLYDSRAQALVDFVPLVPGKVGLYVCGPTVQSSPHIGHLRSALVYDLWRRWFEYRGLDVTLVRNVTDIDDKVLDLASQTSEEWWARAYRFELEFTAGYRALGILAPTYEPRATASVTEMQTIVARLVEGGHAYPAPDGSGDVYFDTLSWPEYGALTHQKLDDMASAT